MYCQNNERAKSRARCAVPGIRTLDSAHSSWSGLPMMAKQLADRGQLRDHVWSETILSLVTLGQAKLKVESDTESFEASLFPGSFVALPAGYSVRSLSWTGTHEQTIVSYSPDRFKGFDLKPSAMTVLRPTARFGFCDRELEGIVRTMRLEIEAGCPSGTLFGESLSLALFARLATDVWKSPHAPATLKATLTATQQQRVREYVAEHLTHDLGLADLAALIGTSPGHFARLFRNTFGMPPYHYIIGQRIDAAKRVMADGSPSILETALLLGFSSQSHFTVAFRKVTGTTPRQFLAQL